MTIYKDRELVNEDGTIPEKLLIKCLEEHNLQKIRYLELLDYYEGKHKILNRVMSNEDLPNNKLVCNHASYITDMAVGYVFGVPISYSGEGNGDELLNQIFTEIDEDSHNNELALDISILGIGNELIYMNDEDIPGIELAVLSPLNTFVVFDTTVKHKPIFAVNYTEKQDIEGTVKGLDVNVYTKYKLYRYFTANTSFNGLNLIDENEHYFDDIPIIEYKNNKTSTGDFETVLTLIDAYNTLQSDRINDKAQLADALLAVIGASLGDDETEQTNTAKLIKEMKILELDEGGDAKYLTKQLNETEVEVLKKSIKDDIHEFSKVPCLTDENFVGNSSGVAMKYKLLGFEQLAKTKERYFKKGLRQRIKLIANLEGTRAKIIDSNKIDIVMKRSLPVDDELKVRILQETEGSLSWETRIKEYNPEIDTEEEKKRLYEENQKKIEQQQKAFGSYDIKSTEKDGEVDEE
ncbi:phage portal protein [Clostridium septicum]|uniref:Phage portal protein n=1 Tax=Clostridium septicum TaxID=1504 RepID=A0A9N7JMZ4_CLOSE|nr:phage portal protein [Clostridium septicum]AYE35684.1 phage portal protein [Clostridium septicum]UEC19640.1 phage portal protein [Clostridium septicum]USS02299.1 phage portal protein [Clostridium septicum]